jgi:hypothetical protein
MEVLEALESRETKYWLIRLFTFFFVFLQLLEAQQEKSLRLTRRCWVKSRQILAICRYPFIFQCGFLSNDLPVFVCWLFALPSKASVLLMLFYLLEFFFLFCRYRITSHCCAKLGIIYSGSWKSMSWITVVFIPIHLKWYVHLICSVSFVSTC